MSQTQGEYPRKVRLFVTCLVDHISPEVGEAVVTVFERLGIEVTVPTGQTCCGQPAFNGGFWGEARNMAKHTIKTLEKETSPIVVPSGSCADMMIHHYPDLFKEEPDWQERARRIAAMTFEFTQFLVDVLEVVDLGVAYQGKVTYHPSCHLLRGLHIDRQPRLLLERVEGAEIVPMPDADQCCGFGGLFSVKFPAISQDMLHKKLEAIDQTGTDQVVGCDLSCLMHINAGLHRKGKPVKAMHIARLLAGLPARS